MKCKICQEYHPTNSGAFTKHLKNKHDMNRDEYYYLFNKKEKCIICDNHKKVKDWKFKLLDTCNSKECNEINRRRKISESQNLKVKNNKHVFQDEKLRLNKSNKLKEMSKNNIHPFQDEKLRKELSISLTKRNIINNPMKNYEARKKSSLSHTGKILSKAHRDSISKGLSKYLSNLDDMEFTLRMRNTEFKPTPIDILLNRYEYSNTPDNINFEKLNELVFGNTKVKYSEFEVY